MKKQKKDGGKTDDEEVFIDGDNPRVNNPSILHCCCLNFLRAVAILLPLSSSSALMGNMRRAERGKKMEVDLCPPLTSFWS